MTLQQQYYPAMLGLFFEGFIFILLFSIFSLLFACKKILMEYKIIIYI
jgi:hypothetical protein